MREEGRDNDEANTNAENPLTVKWYELCVYVQGYKYRASSTVRAK
jgi:hypothetical protein